MGQQKPAASMLLVVNFEEERKREMSQPISVAEAARTLNVHHDQLAWWIRWFFVMQPDARGNVTPQQVVDFLRSDWKRLLPLTKLATVKRRRAVVACSQPRSEEDPPTPPEPQDWGAGSFS